MMISLQTLNETGKECPKCGHDSVFKINIWKWFRINRVIYKCFMGDCNYIKVENNGKKTCVNKSNK